MHRWEDDKKPVPSGIIWLTILVALMIFVETL